ncbi:MAG: hypothetical protein IJU63_08180 [Bacteroidales bacterium]|nr:hypothetical protein [Bacteroidales bacterium]
MKRIRLLELLLLLLPVVACDVLESGRLTGRPGKGVDIPGEVPETGSRFDTCVFVSAVRVSGGYDWRRDVGFEASACSVVLYRDFEVVLTLPADGEISPDPDMHHILDGHLYTEYAAWNETVVRRDGQLVARWAGRERLCGLWAEGDAVYTLGQNRSGEGFSLRRNGAVLFSRNSGQVVGSLSDASFPRTGALCRDAGDFCFFFTDGPAHARTLHLVRGDRAQQLGTVPIGSSLVDARIVDGRVYSLALASGRADLCVDGLHGDEGNSPGLSWTDARIFPEPGGVALAGQYVLDGEAGSGVLHRDGRLERKGGPDCVIYGDGTSFSALDISRSTGIGALFYFFHGGCATYFDSRLYAALSPRNPSEAAMVSCGAQVQRLDLDGYLTGIAVSVVPAEQP